MFYTYSTSQFRPAWFQVLSRYMGPVAPVLDSAAPHGLALITSPTSAVISLHVFDHTLVKLTFLLFLRYAKSIPILGLLRCQPLCLGVDSPDHLRVSSFLPLRYQLKSTFWEMSSLTIQSKVSVPPYTMLVTLIRFVFFKTYVFHYYLLSCTTSAILTIWALCSLFTDVPIGLTAAPGTFTEGWMNI